MPSILRPAPDKEPNGDLPLCSRHCCPLWTAARCAVEGVSSFPHFCEPELRRIKKEHAELVELGKTAAAFAAALKKASF